MYNVCTIMYTHIRSQASDWNCCAKRLFVCAQQRVREREREREAEMQSVCRERKGVCFEIEREEVCGEIDRGSVCGERKR